MTVVHVKSPAIEADDQRAMYSGPVFDGPLKGKHRAEHRPMFYVSLFIPMHGLCDAVQEVSEAVQYVWDYKRAGWACGLKP